MIPENPKTLKAETLANTESKSPEVKENTGAQTRHTPTTCKVPHPPRESPPARNAGTRRRVVRVPILWRCTYITIYIYIIYIYTHACMCMHVCMYVCRCLVCMYMYIWMNVDVLHVCICMYMCIYIYICAHIQLTYADRWISSNLRVCTYIRTSCISVFWVP